MCRLCNACNLCTVCRYVCAYTCMHVGVCMYVHVYALLILWYMFVKRMCNAGHDKNDICILCLCSQQVTMCPNCDYACAQSHTKLRQMYEPLFDPCLKIRYYFYYDYYYYYYYRPRAGQAHCPASTASSSWKHLQVRPGGERGKGLRGAKRGERVRGERAGGDREWVRRWRREEDG